MYLDYAIFHYMQYCNVINEISFGIVYDELIFIKNTIRWGGHSPSFEACGGPPHGIQIDEKFAAETQ